MTGPERNRKQRVLASLEAEMAQRLIRCEREELLKRLLGKQEFFLGTPLGRSRSLPGWQRLPRPEIEEEEWREDDSRQRFRDFDKF